MEAVTTLLPFAASAPLCRCLQCSAFSLLHSLRGRQRSLALVWRPLRSYALLVQARACSASAYVRFARDEAGRASGL